MVSMPVDAVKVPGGHGDGGDVGATMCTDPADSASASGFSGGQVEGGVDAG
ncbi:hypothetical protein [Dermatophilus congolensis]|uniref:hypothetical protein n=1 Tax=Dermatophilus congolensis TaxID=1863 RepID=UPI001AAE4123|nr:hypothetical protein [Dermatophilus congolensis]MBO3142524.1 hypothetical protein [Dermatophilus congolensis]MBO3151514.1 hypothetical protein [Dermatophilus congolensis]MBO3161484.1 hypothetical protein [Dermatophilus congolensis]MBO3162799.1 hypothetical protein [Dermatophilus congolensis]MBO3176353.1 hypothetical protein [Dermatophilus congolensis]